MDKLAVGDLVQEKAWRDLSTKFEADAFDKISRVDGNHLLMLLLTIPLFQHQGKSLLQVAVEQKRMEFLNNARVNKIIQV